MGRKGRRPAVAPDRYNYWAERFESGESVLQIAKIEGYDPRTVRRYLQVAQERKEAMQARAEFLRDALKEHHSDYVELSRRIGDRLNVSNPHPLWEGQDRLLIGLKEHLHDAAMWGNIRSWERLQVERAQVEAKAVTRMERLVRNRKELEFAGEARPHGLDHEGMSTLVVTRLVEAARSEAGELERYVFKEQLQADGRVALLCHSLSVALVKGGDTAAAATLVQALLDEIPAWDEVKELTRLLSKLDKLTEDLREELETIRLRRVVPGRCRYCPV